jgi:hypothetical protein
MQFALPFDSGHYVTFERDGQDSAFVLIRLWKGDPARRGSYVISTNTESGETLAKMTRMVQA